MPSANPLVLIATQKLKQYHTNAVVVQHKSALEFRHCCLEWLSEEEIPNHSVISLADALDRGAPIFSPPFVFCHVRSDEEIQGCCIYAEPDGLVLSQFAREIGPLLFAHIEQQIELPSRIFGPKAATLEIAELFAAVRKSKYRVHSTWLSHIIEDEPLLMRPAEGYVRSATDDDYDLVRDWGAHYDREKPANLSIERFLLSKLAEGNLRFWVNSAPVCLAAISGMSCSGPRVSAVYTPSAMRGHGYASTLVHHLTEEFLAAGRPYVTLSTQVGDPVERIYQKLGYRPVGERVSVVLEQDY